MRDDDISRLRDDLHREITFLKDQLNALATDFKILIACNPALVEQVRERASGAGAGIHGVHGCQMFVNKYGSQ
jgi:predicted trehalose synthase